MTMEAHLQEDILTSKSDFEAKLVYDFSHSKSSKIFSYIKSISKQDSFPPTMSLENMVASTDQSKAELFNQFFFSVYSQRSSEVSFLSSLPAKVLCSLDISVPDVFAALVSLDPAKAKGIDHIGPMVLKSCAEALCSPIHHLFCVSLSTGKLPAEWRTHLITPIFKSGDKSSVKNYRPISLLCTISKVLERLVFICVADHVADYISNCQFGFTKGRSSQQQLLIMLDIIYTNFENKIYSDVAYLDLKKAFDSVDHNNYSSL